MSYIPKVEISVRRAFNSSFEPHIKRFVLCVASRRGKDVCEAWLQSRCGPAQTLSQAIVSLVLGNNIAYPTPSFLPFGLFVQLSAALGTKLPYVLFRRTGVKNPTTILALTWVHRIILSHGVIVKSASHFSAAIIRAVHCLVTTD